MHLLLLAVLSTALHGNASSPAPSFRHYPATEALHGRVMLPRIVDADEREFHTILHQAVIRGYNVVEGGTEHERRGPNFDGHFVLVQWGCGSACMEGALIDANTGRVLRLPQIPGAGRTGFHIPTVDLQSLLFRTRSRLLGVEDIGDAQTYYYLLEHGGWRFLEKLPTPENR